MELIFDLYKDSLKDVIDSNIDDRIPDKNNSLQLLKPRISAFWPKKAILLLFKHFSNNTRAINSKDNNSSIFLLNNLSSKLLPSIIFHNSLNLLLKSNNCRL